MRRVLLAFVSIAALVATALSPASSEPSAKRTITLRGAGPLVSLDAPDDLTMTVDDEADPLGRAQAWLPQDPGTHKWVTLEYGPYVVNPGSDLSRLDTEIVGADGFATGFVPSVVDVNGEEISSHRIHIHHAHWFWLDPSRDDTHRWIYGTGEERTQGSMLPATKADPRFDDGLRYGVKLSGGDRLAFLSMLHNKTAEAMVVFLRVRIQYAYGSAEEIKQAKDLSFRNLDPILLGSTFNVPRSKGLYTFPLDTTKKTIGRYSNYHNPIPNVEIVPGVGQVATMPRDGTVLIGAGHSHPGAKEVVVSNLGRTSDPCPEDGDRFPGVTAVRSRNITRGNVFPSAEFQMGLTQPGWRMYVRKGDRLVVNGVYDSTHYAYPDAMSYFGMYVDSSEKTSGSEVCKVELLNRPGASKNQITKTEPNQAWEDHHHMPTCNRCDEPGAKPEPGLETNTVHIVGNQYLPGNLGLEGSPLGPPVVKKGDTLTFINEDYSQAAVRHSVTSCRAPCNGPFTVNYPMHDGVFHSGALGYMWEETYINARPEPYWEFDTSSLDKGHYTYYCQLHAWMRGSFYIK